MLDDQILYLSGQLLNSSGSLSDGGSIDNGNDQGSANHRWRVDGNWCRNFILNWRLNSSPLRFRGRSLNRCRQSLDWNGSWNWRLDWHQIGEHDREHLLNPETDDFGPRCIQVDVTTWFENVFSNRSLSIQQ